MVAGGILGFTISADARATDVHETDVPDLPRTALTRTTRSLPVPWLAWAGHRQGQGQGQGQGQVQVQGHDRRQDFCGASGQLNVASRCLGDIAEKAGSACPPHTDLTGVRELHVSYSGSIPADALTVDCLLAGLVPETMKEPERGEGPGLSKASWQETLAAQDLSHWHGRWKSSQGLVSIVTNRADYRANNQAIHQAIHQAKKRTEKRVYSQAENLARQWALPGRPRMAVAVPAAAAKALPHTGLRNPQGLLESVVRPVWTLPAAQAACGQKTGESALPGAKSTACVHREVSALPGEAMVMDTLPFRHSFARPDPRAVKTSRAVRQVWPQKRQGVSVPVRTAASGQMASGAGGNAPMPVPDRKYMAIADGPIANGPIAGRASAGRSLPVPLFGGEGRRAIGRKELKVPRPLAGLVPAADTSAAPQDVRGPGNLEPFSLDDELILEFRTVHGEIAETITAYGNRADTYLPLGEIARLLDLAIVISDDGRYASGWVLDDTQVLAINLRAGTISVGGNETALGQRDARGVDGELFLRAGLFSRLMPIDLKVDLRAQIVTAQTRQPFPFEQRAARQAAREKLAARGTGAGTNSFELEDTPYRALDVPLADIEVRGVSDVARGTRTEVDLRLAGDLAYLTSQLFVAYSSRDGVTAARATLGRRDPDEGLLGPIQASVFELGDVTTDALPIGLRGVAGRGVTVSNLPIERASVFDRIDLRGELLAGWEAELYRNNTLIGSTSVAVNGRYEFLQIPVEFGLNVFRIALYGPQGQRREVVQSYSVGDGRLATGELRYSFSVAQRDVNLFGLTPPDFFPSLDFGLWRSTGQLSYGVSTAITANVSGAWYQRSQGSGWLATTGLRAGLGRLAGQINVATNSDRGIAVDARLAGKTLGIAWSALHAEYKGQFADELRAFTAEPVKRATEADLAATVRLGSGDRVLSIPVAARLRQLSFADGRSQTEASLRASGVRRQILFSNTLSLFRNAAPGGRTDSQLLGTFDLVTLSGGQTRYRASVDYKLTPGRKITRAGLDVDRTLGPDTLVKASAARLFDTNETVLGASAVHRLGPLALALDASVILPRKEHAVVLRVGFSFGRNPLSQKFFLSQPGLASGGAAAIVAYSDANGNRRRDSDELPIAGAEINTGSQTVQTGADGVAFLGQLGNASRMHLRLSAETLPDIAMAPDRSGFSVKPRPGRVHVSQFPVDLLGEIDGTAVYGPDRRGVAGLALVLLNSRNEPVARTRTGAGGTFLFEQVRPGSYRLRIDGDQAKRLGVTAGDAGSIVITQGQLAKRLTLPIDKVTAP